MDLQTDSTLQSLREDEFSTPSTTEAKNTASEEPLFSSLLSFLFRTTHLDLLAATHAKGDRTASSLKQTATIIERLRKRIVSFTESLDLFKTTYDLLRNASVANDTVSLFAFLI